MVDPMPWPAWSSSLSSTRRPLVLAAWKRFEEKGEPAVPALYSAMDHVLKRQAEKLPIHNRFTADMKEIWAMQPRFLHRSGKRPYRLLQHPHQ